MPESNELLSAGAALVGMPLAGPESFSPQQLDYLKRALGVDETVLWSGNRYWWSDTSNLQLSEAASNFEVIRVKVKDDWALPPTFIFFPGNNAGFDVSLIGYEGGTLTIKSSKFSVSGSTVSLAEKIMWQVKTDKTVNVNTDTSFIQFSEIVGIHRIAGGN